MDDGTTPYFSMDDGTTFSMDDGTTPLPYGTTPNFSFDDENPNFSMDDGTTPNFSMEDGTTFTFSCTNGPSLFGGKAGLKEAFEKTYVPWICVEGYKTSLPATKIEEMLTKHFSSCGRITDVYIPSDNKRCAYIYIAGVGSANKAVELSGSKVGGRRIVAYISDIPSNNVTPDGPYGNTLPAGCSKKAKKMTPLGPYGNTFPAGCLKKAKKLTLPGPYGNTFPAGCSKKAEKMTRD